VRADFESDVKSDKYCHPTGTSNLAWKHNKDHRDFSARDVDRNDQRIGVQFAGGSVEQREIQRDDQDAENRTGKEKIPIRASIISLVSRL
jgi:hypothetical protein